MSESINKKAVKGVSWSMIDTLTNYFIHFFIGIVLARLLSPSDYGLIGMITVFITISDTFVNAGFGQAFIHKQNATDLDASTIFVINLVLGVLLYALFWFCAPVIAKFYNEPILVDLIRVLFLVIIIDSLTVIQYSIIRKELLFKKKAFISITASLLSGVAGVICAYKGLGVWSLVVMSISNKFILCVLYYLRSSWHISFRFSGSAAKSLFSYGGWLMVANLVASVFEQFYTMAIGKLYSSSELGYYSRAGQFKKVFTDSFVWVFGTVAFPVFAQLQDKRDELQKSLTNFIMYSSFVVFPLVAILYVVAEPFIIFLITDKWLMAVPLLKAFCVLGLMSPIYSFMAPVLQGTGNAKTCFVFTIAVAIARVVNVLVVYKSGIVYIILGDFVVQVLSVVITSLCVKEKLGFNFVSCLKSLKFIVVAMILSAISGLVVLHFLHSIPLVQIIVVSVTMASVYLAVMLALQKSVFKEIYTLIKR